MLEEVEEAGREPGDVSGEGTAHEADVAAPIREF
jgi:hypothetical protein